MPAPETPITIKSGGSQQQLEAMIAESIVPTLVINSARPDELPLTLFVAPGDLGCLDAQQSVAVATSSSVFSDISVCSRSMEGYFLTWASN